MNISLAQITATLIHGRQENIYPQFFFFDKEKNHWHLGMGIDAETGDKSCPVSFFVPSFWQNCKALSPALYWSNNYYYASPSPSQENYLNFSLFKEGIDTTWLEFLDLFQHFQKENREQKLQKIVLARQKFLYQSPVNFKNLMNLLLQRTEASFIFYFAPNENECFISNSPERLFKREGDHLIIDVIAGTRPRGLNEEDDERLSFELMSSDKEGEEQSIVEKELLQILNPVSRLSALDLKKNASRPRLLKLEKLMHLQTQLNIPLKSNITNGDLLELLHPTAAVGGAPKQAALEFLQKYERPLFERTYYAAPCGFASRIDHCADFCVGIRCAHINFKENIVCLTAGAGIMPNSDPSAEWLEMEKKLGHMESLILQSQKETYL